MRASSWQFIVAIPGWLGTASLLRAGRRSLAARAGLSAGCGLASAMSCADLIGIRSLQEERFEPLVGDAGGDAGATIVSPPIQTDEDGAGDAAVSTFFGHYSFSGGPSAHRVEASAGILARPQTGGILLHAGSHSTERGGELALGEDGSFVYRPSNGSFWGDDHFEMAAEAVRVRLRLTVQPAGIIDASQLQQGIGSGIAIAGGTFFGASIASAGDIDGDGYEDIVVGETAPARDDALVCDFETACTIQPLQGVAHVIFGRAENSPIIMAEVASGLERAFTIRGAGATDPLDGAGYSVAGAGDVNGDGLDDVLVGAPSGAAQAGAAYLVFGKADNTPVLAASLPPGLCALDAAERGLSLSGQYMQSRVGWAVAGGDMNGDGLSDLSIAAPLYIPGDRTPSRGAVYVLLGQGRGCLPGLLTPEYDGQFPGFLLAGSSLQQRVGRTLSNAGDFNGDGIDDLVIGGHAAGGQALAHVVFGARVKRPSNPVAIYLSAMESIEYLAIVGPADSSAEGIRAAAAGDVNADGLEDVLLLTQRSGAPSVFVVFGRTDTLPVSLDGIASGDGGGYVIRGFVSHIVTAVAGAGDVDGDGFADVVLGGGVPSGGKSTSYVVFGKSDTAPVQLYNVESDPSLGRMIQGTVDDALGHTVAAGDVNADGLDDVLLGAPAHGVPQSSGAAYVVFGWDMRNSLGDRDGAIVRGSANDSIDYPTAPFVKIAGGNGLDTLRVPGIVRSLDLRARVPRIESIEIIDLGSEGGTRLIIDDAVLRRLPQGRQNLAGGLAKMLTVVGGPDDIVETDWVNFDVLDNNPGRIIYGRRGTAYGIQILGPSIAARP